MDRHLQDTTPATPCVVIDLATVRARFAALQALLPDARILYAVKANPAAPVIAALAALACAFDLASAGEIDRCVGLGIGADRVCFGNTIKRESDIARAHALGIDLFAFDSAGELDKLARAAPGARVFCRISVHGRGAEWPLTRKFGCAPRMATELLVLARARGLRPVGLSFHVGSQQVDPNQWAIAIGTAAEVFRACRRGGVALELLNIGGGLPAQYRTPVPPLTVYTATILAALHRHFGGSQPALMVEPGRYMVGDAGMLRSQVLLIARHGNHDDRRWVYLDAGRYNGLAETQGESIRYRLRTPHDGTAAEPVILAGPTCDSTDIIYDRAGYTLPLALAIGDSVDFLSAGAYTASYASVEFNGFPPLATYCL
ncbi:MAG: type III PLP-dependent enzyme [Rhodospirillales bacterium]|nr:type III PLP-dependent enzyme [Rhodospirillales bacterium]